MGQLCHVRASFSVTINQGLAVGLVTIEATASMHNISRYLHRLSRHVQIAVISADGQVTAVLALLWSVTHLCNGGHTPCQGAARDRQV